ncbi:DUF3100 domain-containing protein [Acidipropionibacterium virtanenii]|uniref:DUF3100 domain-containing protein n=1 Tax=Acidipropionibacterium virtanenii TaxID=2057246 RepID=A0A344UPY0_9ACTN|nr:DUF3100 domain-containing protein [Acidipropionibacterium virtanenii]AXE37328.1 hypothetical protein JS278_00131 [Acidipropionibacterium virtanenii]
MAEILEAPESAETPNPASTPEVLRMTLRSRQLWIVIGFTVLVASIAELIGKVVIPAGVADIVILPMVWGLIMSGIISSQKWKPLGLDIQAVANTMMTVMVLVLLAHLSFTIGPNIMVLAKAGPALMLQEIGHLLGTLVLALPLAVLLRMGPATVGATFSIDREGSFAMVSEKYGTDSPQYRGVLSMYAFGTLFGAVTVGIIASVSSSLKIFDPLALAMGSGVGSGSMMAAATGAVAAAHPEVAKEVTAMAATSNLITTVLGVYVGMWVALPLADRLYKALTRRKAQKDTTSGVRMTSLDVPKVAVPTWLTLASISVIGIVVAVINTRSFSMNFVWCYVILSVLVGFSILVSKLTHGRVSAMLLTVTLGALITTPISPIADFVVDTTQTVPFLAVCTLVLTIAGLSLGKDIPALKAIGWKIIPVGIVAIASSYIFSVVVAEFALGMWG